MSAEAPDSLAHFLIDDGGSPAAGLQHLNPNGDEDDNASNT
jgi:hypothetical protein